MRSHHHRTAGDLHGQLQSQGRQHRPVHAASPSQQAGPLEILGARNILEEIAKGTLLQLKLSAPSQPASEQANYQKAIAQYEQLAAEQARKKDELKAHAEQDQKDYDAANFRDDQFDLADALLAIAISLLAVTALTHLWWLYFLALVPTVFGVVIGVAGLTGWSIHPTVLIQLLS